MRLFILLGVFVESELFDLYVSTKCSNLYALSTSTVSWCSLFKNEASFEVK